MDVDAASRLSAFVIPVGVPNFGITGHEEYHEEMKKGSSDERVVQTCFKISE
jgi:hypothetical protein